MWNCSDIKKGYLSGNLRKLFTHLARDLFSKISKSNEHVTGVDIFDAMEHREKLFSIQYVTSHLISPEGKTPSHRIWSDVVIYAIFRHLMKMGSIHEQVALFRLVASVLDEYKFETEGVELDLSNISFLVLWDIDWDLDVMDLSPENYDKFVSVMGINREYYIDSHPDLVGNVGDWEKAMADTI